MILLQINDAITTRPDSIRTSEGVPQTIELLSSMRDSLNSALPYIIEMAENTKPEPYIVENLNLSWWNLIIAIAAALFGCIGAVCGFFGYKYSRLTAENVSRISSKTQFAIFEDFAKELYKRLIYLLICNIEIKKSHYLRYPSERLIEKLKLPESEYIFKIEKYSNNEKVYMIMRDIGVRMNDYNMEINILRTIISGGEKFEIIGHTLDSVLYKPLKMINHLGYLYFNISKDDTSYSNILNTLLSFHFNHLYHKINAINEWKNDYQNIDFTSYEQDKHHAYYPLAKSLSSLSKKKKRICSNEILNIENNRLNSGVRTLLVNKENVAEWLTPIFELEGGEQYRNVLFEDFMDEKRLKVREEWDVSMFLPIMFSLDIAMELKNISLFEYNGNKIS